MRDEAEIEYYQDVEQVQKERYDLNVGGMDEVTNEGQEDQYIYDELDIERYENIEDNDDKYEDIEETALNQKVIVKVIRYLEIVE